MGLFDILRPRKRGRQSSDDGYTDSDDSSGSPGDDSFDAGDAGGDGGSYD